jgi:uncharacterized membrane protein
MKPIQDIVKGIGTNDKGKSVGIICYFTLIGWLIAYFGFHQSRKTLLGSYQLRQTLLLNIAYIVVWLCLDFLLGFFWTNTEGIFSITYFFRLIEFGFFVLWLVGLIGAINGEKKPIPILGEQAQSMFSTL